MNKRIFMNFLNYCFFSLMSGLLLELSGDYLYSQNPNDSWDKDVSLVEEAQSKVLVGKRFDEFLYLMKKLLINF